MIVPEEHDVIFTWSPALGNFGPPALAVSFGRAQKKKKKAIPFAPDWEAMRMSSASTPPAHCSPPAQAVAGSLSSNYQPLSLFGAQHKTGCSRIYY